MTKLYLNHCLKVNSRSEQKSLLIENPSKLLIKPSASLIQSLLEGLPCQFFSVYFYPEKDIYYDPEFYEPGQGFALLDYKLTENELLTNYPLSWLEEYFDKEMMQVDPVLIKGCEKLQPFCWGHIKSTLPTIPLDSNFNKVLKLSTEYDIVRGISIPLAAGRQCYGVFTVTFSPNYQLSDLQIFSVGSFLQNVGLYLLSYENPSPLKPVEPAYKKVLIETYMALKQQAKLVRQLFK